ncbi:nucleotidyltransferase domain-containing protein [Caldicellulosiruptoraceae bacterium PP1]
MITRSKVDFIHFFSSYQLLKTLFASYGDKIIVAYLFGSVAQKKYGPLSDIDIAVLFNNKLTNQEIDNFEEEIYSKLTTLLKTEEIDLIVLNKAPLSVQYGVIKNKEIIYFSDMTQVVDYQTKLLLTYLDFKPVKDQMNKDYIYLLKKKVGAKNG